MLIVPENNHMDHKEKPRSTRLPSAIDPFFLAILAVAVFFLFFHLDYRPFWQDEAETACLARNVLKTGLPLAFDGVRKISQEQGMEFNSQDYLWRWSPWMQIYVAAGAFRVGGLNTLAGRFPFAFFGLLCVVLVYLLLTYKFQDRGWACISAALLTFCVPFLLYARQCRYYSLVAFFTLATLFFFRSNWQSKLGPACLLVLSLGLLFHTNYLVFGSFLIPALAAAALVYPQDLPVARIAKLALAIGAITIIPGLMLFQFHNQTSMISHYYLFDRIIRTLDSYFCDLLQFMIPLPLGVYLLWRWRGVVRGKFPADPKE